MAFDSTKKLFRPDFAAPQMDVQMEPAEWQPMGDDEGGVNLLPLGQAIKKRMRPAEGGAGAGLAGALGGSGASGSGGGMSSL